MRHETRGGRALVPIAERFDDVVVGLRDASIQPVRGVSSHLFPHFREHLGVDAAFVLFTHEIVNPSWGKTGADMFEMPRDFVQTSES